MLKNTKLYESSEIAEVYLTYRPSWNDPQIMDTIISFCKEQTSADFSLALDVGCGSGQITVPLAKHFQQVIGLDVSKAMISKAPTHIPNLSFRVGPGEDLSFLRSGSVDLVTSTVAIHWMDVQQVHREVERVLKPGGAFVVMHCTWPLLDEPRAQEVIETFDNHVMVNLTSSNFKEEAIKLFQTYTLPFAGFRKCVYSVHRDNVMHPDNRMDSLKIEWSWTVDELVGLLGTLTPAHLHCLKHLADTPPHDVKRRLQEVYQDENGEERRIKGTFPTILLMGHKPQV